MKKELLSFVLACSLVLGCAAPVFAADAAADEGDNAAAAYTIVPNMEFTGNTLTLSLEQAVKRMTTSGAGFESAVLKKEASDAQAKGQEELWMTFVNTSNAMSGLPRGVLPVTTINPMKTLNAKIVKMTRPFLISQSAIQYEIDINILEHETTQVYYQVLQAEEALRIAEENLQNQKSILTNTEKKLEQGMVSKMDLLTAESSVQDAEVKVASAGSALKAVKMSFNQKMNLPLMQDVKLTGTLKMANAPSIVLKSAIEAALSTRNELNQLQYQLDKAQLELDDKTFVSRYSAEYLTAELAIKQVEKGLKDTKQLLELDVRSRYMNIQNVANEIAALNKTVSNAKEGYRLAELSYNAGMNTLVDVHSAQLASFQAQLGLAAKTLEYNLAINDFKMAIGYGTGSSGSNSTTTTTTTTASS
ncbi:MAG: TolC family protein [Clostridiales Family XIII bacterium]|jgi:Tfp pilus assembly protein PilX|nr:TolC family protein [Clostridiales Family XIII bacterium]